MHLDLLLPHSRNNLATVTVEAQKGIANTGFRQQLQGQTLEETRGLSLAESLSKINGVNMLQTGSTISKPVIHGLHSNRILTINNGIRQEGQQRGSEHAPEIDPYIADKLTVIKGVDELKYGSDAIGGVILVDPKPLKHLPGFSGEFNTGYFTNNNQYVASGIFEQQLNKIPALSYRLQGTFKQAGNVSTPGYRLNNTGLKERNFSVAADWKKPSYNVQAFYSQFTTDIGIFTGAHIGNLTDLLNAISQDRPNELFLGQKTYRIRRPRQEVLHRLFKLTSTFNRNKHTFNVTVGAQYNQRKEFDIIRNTTSTSPQLTLSILTLTEQLSWDHPAWHGIKGTAGVSLMQQDNSYSGRYLIPNYFSNTFGGYWIEKWSKNNFDVEGGVRFDRKLIDTKRLRYGGFETNHGFEYSTLAASVNTVYKFATNFRVNANLSLASRAPHVNELLIDGIHEGTGTYEVGDINLRPEQSVNAAVGLSYTNKSRTFSTQLNLYNNAIRNFIYQQPKPDAPVLTIVGAFPRIQYQQTDALLRGVDAEIDYNLTKQLSVSSRASILRAYNRKIDDWLIMMPSDRLTGELTYTFKDNNKISDSYVSAEIANVFKPRVPSDKNGQQDYKPAPGAYTLVNLNASATFQFGHTPVTVGLTVRNLLDRSYREYLNSFRYYTDDMGRNIGIRVKVPFQKLL
jgi:iron complex outermembrane receptor protein